MIAYWNGDNATEFCINVTLQQLRPYELPKHSWIRQISPGIYRLVMPDNELEPGDGYSTDAIPCAHIAEWYHHRWGEERNLGTALLRKGYYWQAERTHWVPDSFNNLYDRRVRAAVPAAVPCGDARKVRVKPMRVQFGRMST